MNNTIKATYAALAHFLKNPQDQPTTDQHLSHKTKVFGLILVLDLILIAISMGITTLITTLELIDLENHKIMDFLRSMDSNTVFITLIIIVPFIEELIFRLYLRYRHNYVLRGFLSLFFVFGNEQKIQIEAQVKRWWKHQYLYIFYSSALLFGAVHLFNFQVNLNTILLAPFLILAQISVGIFAGYLRVKFGLIWGFFLHATHNLIAFIPFFLMGDTIELLHENTAEYEIRIEEAFRSSKKPNDATWNFFPDSVHVEHASLIDLVSFTHGVENWRVETNRPEKANKYLSLSFKNKIEKTIKGGLIADKLSEILAFNLTDTIKSTEVSNLILIDTVRLMTHRTDSSAGNYIQFSQQGTKVYRSPLQKAVFALKRFMGKDIFLKSNLGGRFNIELTRNDTLSIEDQLISKYGLQLVDSTAELKHVFVEFEE